MEKIKLNPERCKGCLLCLAYCKAGALSLSGQVNGKGASTVKVNQEKCRQCGSCYAMCPELVFEIL